MSLVRPEAKAALWRWRECLSGAAVLTLGLYWAWFTGGGLLHWIGYVVASGGLALIVAGVPRGRFRTGGGGPGVVKIIEGQITYFGPLNGGAVALTEVRALRLDPRGKPAHWVLEQTGQPPLHIPLNAEGAEALFDAFAALPGLDTAMLVTRMRAPGDVPTQIWQRAPARKDVRRLH